MKKIAGLAIAAVFAASAAYADQISGTNFESLETGSPIGAATPDSASTTAYYWLGGDAVADLKNQVVEYGEETKYAGTVGVPDAYKTGAQTKYLSVNTVGTLKRTVNAATLAEGDVETITPYTDLANAPLFIDTLVKFTPSEIEPTANEGDKFVIWMDANSNLVVRAGAYVLNDQDVDELQAVNVTLNGEFRADTWYRLTVQILPDIFNVVQMAVYIDGVKQTYSAEAYVPYHGDLWQSFVDDTEVPLPEDIAALKNQNALFLATYEGDQSISYLGFEGIGAVDDISFTLDAPAFLNGETTLAFTLALDESVTGITYTISGTEGTQTTVGTIQVPANGTVTVTGITAADWFTTTPVLTATQGATAAESVFTVAAAGATGTIAAAPVAVSTLVGENVPALTVDKIKTWAQANGIDYDDILAEADKSNVLKSYLMNDDGLEPSGLKVASIEKVEDGVEFTFVKTDATDETIETDIDDAEDINGVIYVWQGDTIEEMNSATPTQVVIAEGVVTIETTKKFFKFKVDLPPAAAPAPESGS